eukprot:13269637-Heterocapsa_arctica.AAC.1
MNARLVHRHRDEVLLQVWAARRSKALDAKLRLELRGGIQEELAHLAREVRRDAGSRDQMVTPEKLADGGRR